MSRKNQQDKKREKEFDEIRSKLWDLYNDNKEKMDKMGQFAMESDIEDPYDTYVKLNKRSSDLLESIMNSYKRDADVKRILKSLKDVPQKPALSAPPKEEEPKQITNNNYVMANSNDLLNALMGSNEDKMKVINGNDD